MSYPDRPTRLRCLNPTCDRTCSFRPHSRGRQPTFCSPNCRAKYAHMRDSLCDELKDLEASLPASGKTMDTELTLRIAHIRWLLRRYQ